MSLQTVLARSGNLRTASVLSGIYLYARVQGMVRVDPIAVDSSRRPGTNWRTKITETLVRSGLARRVMGFRMRDGSRVRCRIVDGGGLLSVHVDRDYDVPTIDWEALRTIVDVGAHVGSFTVWAARRAARARCLAIEPNPETFALLVRNIHDNGLQDRVTAVNAGVAGRSGMATLQLLEHSLGTRLGRPGDSTVSVNIGPLQTYIKDAQMQSVDLLKIDCEGMEYEALAAMDRNDLRQINVVACEYHPEPGHDVAELDGILAAAGFSVERQDAPLGILWATR